MKVPWKWLNQYTDLPWDPQETADRLTMAGINVEELTYQPLEISSVVSAKIVETQIHPQRPDHKIATIDTGDGKLNVISSASGFKEGNIILLALPGATLPGGIKIEPKQIYGSVSEAMVICTNELLTGQPPRPNEDIIILPENTKLGVDAKELFELDDWVLELELTVNYSHCLGILGVAIEAAALAKTELKLPNVLEKWNWASARGSKNPSLHRKQEHNIHIDLPEPELCKRYVAKVITDVKYGYSPVNIERRLYLAGQRPINLIVDATNYIMIETGQPLHAFDVGKLNQQKIVVRGSRPGEKLVTLDSEERTLPPGTIVITDSSGPIAIGAIMGGKSTEITDTTSEILIESAYFDPISVRRASQKLKLRTEAAIRFEKGIDPTAQAAVAERAVDFITTLSGGLPVPGYAEANHFQIKPKQIVLRMETVKRVLGTELSSQTCKKLLENINFEVEEMSQHESKCNSISVVVPPRRVDINAEVDLVEEIARHYGYDNLGTDCLSKVISGDMTDRNQLKIERIRDMLASLGGMECLTNSLIDPKDLERLGWVSEDPRNNPVYLENPLSSQESVLRPSILPGLINVVSTNIRVGNSGGFIWEIGRIFFPSDKLPIETIQIGLASYGILKPKTWLTDSTESGFYQMKGILSTFLDLLGISKVEYLPKAGMPFHPGKSAKLLANMSTIGEIGELHPRCLQRFDISLPMAVAWLSTEGLLSAIKSKEYQPVSNLMPVERDLAIIVPEQVAAGHVIESIQKTSKFLTSVILFDVWRKAPVPPNHKSLALKLIYQPYDKTLTEEELSKDRHMIMNRLKREYGAVLRA